MTSHPGEYQEPARTILFLLLFLGCAAFVLLSFYWVFTPRPLLQMNASSLVYRPFPLQTRTIYWVDVVHISAFTWRQVNLISHTNIMTLSFMVKPHGMPAAGKQQLVRVDISTRYFSLKPKELVRLMRNYHAVQLFKNRTNTKVGRRTRQRG